MLELQCVDHPLEHLEEVFVDGRKRRPQNAEADSDALYQQIGRLKVELDWLKKLVYRNSEERRRLRWR